jgi:hypothetical protein
MFYVLGWFVVLGLLALWSVAAWAFHAVAVWAVSNAGALKGAASGALSEALSDAERLGLPDWLAPWIPAEGVQAASAWLSGLAPAVEWLLDAAPSLADGLSLATWVIWGIGSVMLLLVGAGLHLLIAMWRRRDGGSAVRVRPA